MLSLGIILILFTIVINSLNVASNYIQSAQGQQNQQPQQQQLICPTPPEAKGALQLFNCYMNTPTPTTPPTPTPTRSPVIPSSTGAPNPTATEAVDPCESQLTDYPAIKQALLTIYQINLLGAPDVDIAKQTLTTMCKLKNSSTFTNLLTSQGVVPITYKDDVCGNLRGVADMNSSSITITGKCDQNLNRGVLVHELTHIIQFRNPNVFNGFLNSVWPANIPTYNCQIHYGDGRTPMECFADGSAEYVVYNYLRIQYNGEPAGPATFQEYPTAYVDYYNFFRDNIYGGVSFTGF